MKKGFTLIEILVYIGILTIIISAVFSFLIWAINSNTKAMVMREVSDNARQSMEFFSREIKEAKSIYTPTSFFDSHPGQLSLEKIENLSEGEKISFVDFYLCDNRICFKKESQDPIVLTSDNLEVTDLIFTQVITDQIPSIQIELKIDYKNPENRPEYRASINLKSAVSLRSY